MSLTHEVPRKVDGKYDGHRKNTDYCLHHQDVSLEGEVGGSINPTLALDFLIPEEKRDEGMSAQSQNNTINLFPFLF